MRHLTVSLRARPDSMTRKLFLTSKTILDNEMKRQKTERKLLHKSAGKENLCTEITS